MSNIPKNKPPCITDHKYLGGIDTVNPLSPRVVYPFDGVASDGVVVSSSGSMGYNPDTHTFEVLVHLGDRGRSFLSSLIWSTLDMVQYQRDEKAYCKTLAWKRGGWENFPYDYLFCAYGSLSEIIAAVFAEMAEEIGRDRLIEQLGTVEGITAFCEHMPWSPAMLSFYDEKLLPCVEELEAMERNPEAA